MQKNLFLLFLVLCVFISLNCDKKNPAKPEDETELPDGDFWMMNVSLPIQMLSHTCELNGKIYSLCGITERKEFIKTIYQFDPERKKWTAKGETQIERMAYSVSAVNGKIYIFGGLKTCKGNALRHVEEYDPATGICKMVSYLPNERPRACFSTSVVNGKIYLIGGLPICGEHAWAAVDVYDPVTNEWTYKVTELPFPRYKLTASVVNGKIYVIGGQSGRNRDESQIYKRVDVYDPATNDWTTATDMPTARRDLRSEVLDGKIYVFGGRGYGEGLKKTEMYDLETATWDTTKADMIIGRYYHGSSVVNGKIYAVSGVTEAQSDPEELGKPIGDHEDYTK